MYVAVKGGERAIERSWELLAKRRRGDAATPELSVAQIREQLRLAVARVMTEGSVYDEELAALAIKQAAGDLVEAIFLCAPTARRCRVSATRCRSIRKRCASSAAFRPRSRTFPADRCSAARMTIRSASSTSPCLPKERR